LRSAVQSKDEVELEIDELSNDVLRKLSAFLQAQAPQPDDAPEKKMTKLACSVENDVYKYLFGNKDVTAMVVQDFLNEEHLRLAEKKMSEVVEEHKKAKKELEAAHEKMNHADVILNLA
jgi:hypothetical protein